MSLERKDVRLKITPEAHAQLAALADLYEKDISELGSMFLERSILGEAHVAKINATRVARWGTGGNHGGTSRESAGVRPVRAVK